MKYRFSRIRDRNTGKILLLLGDRLKVPKYQQYQDESMESAVGLSVHLLCKRSRSEIDRIWGSYASRWTNCRRFFEFSDRQCQFGDMKGFLFDSSWQTISQFIFKVRRVKIWANIRCMYSVFLLYQSL
jgi:hypothetical protein